MEKNGSLVYRIKTRDGTLDASVNARFTAEPPKSGGGKLHFHAEYELFFCDERELVLTTDGGEKRFSRCAVVVPPNFLHTTVREGYGYVVRFTPVKGEVPWKEVTALPLSSSVAFYLAEIERALASLSYAEKLPPLLTLLFLELTETPAQNEPLLPVENQTETVESVLFNRYKEKLSLNDLAAALCVSPRQASRIVKKRYGVTFGELLRNERIRRAGELLLQTDCSVSQVALSCGFENENYFFVRFKEIYGVTPAEFRKKKR